MRWSPVCVALLFAGCLSGGDAPASDPVPDDPGVPPTATPVVVATFDTGTNPFHPCFRRPGADPVASGALPAEAAPRALRLNFSDTYEEALESSQAALEGIATDRLTHALGTQLLFYGTPTEFVDDYPHGAQASSQIVCEEYGLAPDAWLLIVNWYDGGDNPARLRWVASRPWIDIIHLNIQDTPNPVGYEETDAIRELIATGKLVVIAGGNGVSGGGANYPMELSAYNGPTGSLIAGAIDNGGGTTFSNLDPHVAMDGCGTRAAAPTSYDETGFSGTSSASPRITGYAARLLWEVRNATGAQRGDGLLAVLPDLESAPAVGPLSDGSLTAAEVHETIRKTADPQEHDSWMDGTQCGNSIPVDPGQEDRSFYAKMGYGEVSEHTLPDALSVVLGSMPMPPRPNEDMWFEQSENLRHELWDG